MDKTTELVKKAKKYFSPALLVDWWKDDPLILVEGKATVVKDIKGNEYIDLMGGPSVLNVGYCPPKVVSAIKEQTEKLIGGCPPGRFYLPQTVECAKKIAKLTPNNLEKSFFLNSGTETIECAIAMARKYTEKSEIIGLYHSFHGRTYGSISLTGNADMKRKRGPGLPGMHLAPGYYCYRCSLGLEYPNCGVQCAQMIEDVIRYQTWGDVAAFIAEPMLGTAGMIDPPKEYFKIVKEILDTYDILFIDDEVQTCLGRTGKMFAVEHYNVSPDIMTIAKGIAAGLPMGVTVTTEEISRSIKPYDYWSTFGGNPVCCAAANAVIDMIIEEKLVENAARMGDHFMKGFKDLAEDHEIIGLISGLGLLLGIELVKDRKTKEPAIKESRMIRDEARKLGVLIGSGMGTFGNTIRIDPPLTINKEQVDKSLEVIDICLKLVS